MVRYADNPTAFETIDIGAPPAEVWPLVSDPGVPAQFSTELQSAVWGDTGPHVGATIVGTNFHEARGTWTTTSAVTVCDIDREFTWTVGDVDNPTAEWSFRLEAIDTGTRLEFGAVMGPGPSGVSDFIEKRPDLEEQIVANRLAMWRENMRLTLAGIKQLVEAR
jgi:hypothetical protein